MEVCRGGELLHSLGKRHYSERTVRAGRAAQRSVVQCMQGGGGQGGAGQGGVGQGGVGLGGAGQRRAGQGWAGQGSQVGQPWSL